MFPTLSTLITQGNIFISMWMNTNISSRFSNYAPTTTPATISYTINKCSCGKSTKEPKLKNSKYSVLDVCRIRLDYEVFQVEESY